MDKDEKAMQTYLHSDDAEESGTRCTQCGHTIGLNEWSYGIDKQILCDECLTSYMRIYYGKIE